jgi:hypothetical protein
MKLKRAQFVKMNAHREEDPPPREVGCQDYRNCLDEAAFRNYCLDCSLCDSVDATDERPAKHRNPRPNKSSGLPAGPGLMG